MHLHRAGYILDENFNLINNAGLLSHNGIIKELVRNPVNYPKNRTTDHGPGILIPGPVNAHTHLELSFLKGRLDYSKGFKSWVTQLIKKREKASYNEILSTTEKEVVKLENSGVAAIGEISTISASKEIFLNSDLAGYFFYEELGDSDKFLENKKQEKVSFAAHAPHTTSPDLIRKIKERTNRDSLPFSIHCGESTDEILFIRGENKDWVEFLNSRGIDSSAWPVPGLSCVDYLDKLNVIDESTLLVHVLDADENDFFTLKKAGASICVCPRSNINLHNRLPDIERMLEFDINTCIGTDSLASCDSLDLFHEMQFIFNNYKIHPLKLLKMATINGAKALGIDRFSGSIKKNSVLGMIYIDVNEKDLPEAIIFSNESKRKVVK